MIVARRSFTKSSVFIIFPSTLKRKANSSGLKSVFEKLRFRDGLVWTVGLTVEIKLRFQISPAVCGCLVTLVVIFFNANLLRVLLVIF